MTARRAVVDASAAVAIVLTRPAAAEFSSFLADCLIVWAPELFHAEVANSLDKYLLAGDLSADVALDLLERAQDLIDTFVPTARLVEEALFASSQNRHRIYDLLYAVLARRRGAVLLTLDRRQAAIAREMGVAVLLPG